MTNIVFIVLHYKIFDETLNCINSLLKLNSIENCRILVYDNGSNNGSFEKLKGIFSSYPLIDIYKSDKNQGFSVGNNHAYQIAKSYHPQFIITLNNDVVIKQVDFIMRLYNVFNKYKFFVLGPDIYAPHLKAHQNPLYAKYPSLEQLSREMQVFRNNLNNPRQGQRTERIKRYKNTVRHYIPLYFLHLFRILKAQLGLSASYEEVYKNVLTDSVLHGACLIFSELYINENEKLFEPETKFYHEELLLSLKCKTLGYPIIYSPELQVLHYHGVATRKSAKTVEDYVKFHSQSMLDAFVILENTIKDNPWQKNH